MTVSSIIIFVLYVTFLVLLWKNKPLAKKKVYKVVKAGNVDSIRPLTVELKDLYRRNFTFDKALVNASNYEIFIAQGGSMAFAGVKNDDAVFCKRLFGGEKYGITGSPVLIFEIDKSKDVNIRADELVEFKLRKFLGYVDVKTSSDDNWFDDIAKDNRELIDNKSLVVAKYETCVKKYKENNLGVDDFTLILSSTFDTDKKKTSYSFHPIKFLYGVVEYVLDGGKISK